MTLFLNYCIISGSAKALGVVGNYSISWLFTFSVTRMPNIMKIRQCILELQLKMSGMFLRHSVFSICMYDFMD